MPREGIDANTNTANAAPDTGEFLLHACHDLRTALRAIRLHADLLLKDGAPAAAENLAERLRFISEGARKIDLLADGLASYAIALQIRNDEFGPAPMNAIVRNVLARLHSEILANQAAVNYDPLPRVTGVVDRLMEVIENLVRNALCHRGPAAPQVHVSAERRLDDWLFSVRDNGPGVEQADLETIFKPFVRLHGKQRLGPGLGLAICRIIVERHGGRIWAESGNREGLAVLFTLPAT